MADTYRAFTGVLYRDSESYNCDEVLASLGDYFVEFATIVHDKDVNENGELKKEHIHWVGRKKNGSKIETVAKVAGLKVNEIEIVRNFKKMVRYLVHLDTPTKAQYSAEDIDCNFEIETFLDGRNEGQNVLNFVEKRLAGATYMQLLKDSIADGTYSDLRRNYGFIKLVVEEEQEVRTYASIDELIERIARENVERRMAEAMMKLENVEGVQECFEL